MPYTSTESDSSADLNDCRLDHRPLMAEIKLLNVDLSRRVSPAASTKLVAIYRLFIQNGFAWPGLLPIMEGDRKDRQELMLGSLMAALFYAERQITMAMDHLMGRSARTNSISMEQCEKLFNFAKDLAFDFKTQMLLSKRDDPNLGAQLNVH